MTDISPSRVIQGELSLKKNFSWTFIGNVVYAACQWGMISILAKLGDTSMVGQFALAIAVTTPVMALSNLQLRSLQATDTDTEFSFGDYAALRLSTTALALVVIVGVAYFGGYKESVVAVIVAMGFVRAFDAMNDVFYGRFQQAEQMDVIAKAMMVNGIVSVAGLSAGIAITGNLLIGVIGSAMGSLLSFLLVVLPSALAVSKETNETGGPFHPSRIGQILPRWSAAKMISLLRLALPLGVVMFLVSLNTNIPRYVIEEFSGEEALGVFSALAYLLVAGTTVVGALGQSASPRLAKAFASRNLEYFRTLLRKLVWIGLCLGIAGTVLSMVLGKEILSVLYTTEYGQYERVLVLLAVAGSLSFAASFLGYGMTAARALRPQVPLFIVTLCSTMGLSLALVPQYGLTGAAVAVAGGSLVQLVGGALIVLRALETVEGL